MENEVEATDKGTTFPSFFCFYRVQIAELFNISLTFHHKRAFLA